MNLLIVNDEQLTAETMKKDMDWASYGISEVYTAYDTEAARACIAEHPVDILLCDIEMPGENGLGLLRWVREQEKEIECIFLTCHAKFAYAQEAISLGCQDYILIPARYEDIGEKIRGNRRGGLPIYFKGAEKQRAQCGAHRGRVPFSPGLLKPPL